MHDLPSHHEPASRSSASGFTLAGIGIVLAGYIVAALVGWPQYGRDLLVEAQATRHAGPEEHHST